MDFDEEDTNYSADDETSSLASDWWLDVDTRDLELEEKKISLSEARRAFKYTDINFDRELDLEEFKQAFLEMDRKRDKVTPENDVEHYFHQLDVDKSGALEWEEFRMLSEQASQIDVEEESQHIIDDDASIISRAQRVVTQALTASSDVVSKACTYTAVLAPVLCKLSVATIIYCSAAALCVVCTWAVSVAEFLWFKVLPPYPPFLPLSCIRAVSMAEFLWCQVAEFDKYWLIL